MRRARSVQPAYPGLRQLTIPPSLAIMPYWRLSSFYLFYFAALGVLVPFWGLYLKHLGFSAAEIGELMAIPMATKILAPFLWGWLGDRLNQRMRVVRIGAATTVVVFFSVFWLTSYWGIALAMSLFSFFWNAILPQFEVVSLRYLGPRAQRYAQLRLWGSVGFILTVLLLGVGVDTYGVMLVPLALFAIYLGIWLSSLTVTDPSHPPPAGDQVALLSILREPAMRAFLGACFLLQVAHACYYSFYSIYLESAGFSKTSIGWFWSLGVMSEILIFLIMHRLLDRWGARRVLIASLLLATLRWLIIGHFPHSWLLLGFAQLFHAFSFGTFHAAAIHTVHLYFTGNHQGRGQAIYASVSFGAGGAVGSLLSGYLWDGLGASATFYGASVLSLLAAWVVHRWVTDRPRINL